MANKTKKDCIKGLQICTTKDENECIDCDSCPYIIYALGEKEYKNTKYLSVCSESGDYQFTLEEVNSILHLDIEKLLSELKEKAKNFKRDRSVKEVDTTELKELASKITGESKNGEHSTTQE